MKKYETMIILSIDLADDARKALLQSLLDVLKTNKADKVEVNEWGKREFAYEINKQHYGYYYVINFEADNPGLNKEFARICGINPNIVRHLTIAL